MKVEIFFFLCVSRAYSAVLLWYPKRQPIISHDFCCSLKLITWLKSCAIYTTAFNGASWLPDEWFTRGRMCCTGLCKGTCPWPPKECGPNAVSVWKSSKWGVYHSQRITYISITSQPHRIYVGNGLLVLSYGLCVIWDHISAQMCMGKANRNYTEARYILPDAMYMLNIFLYFGRNYFCNYICQWSQ